MDELVKSYETLLYDYNTFCKSTTYINKEKCDNIERQKKNLKEEINRIRLIDSQKLANIQAANAKKSKSNFFSLFSRNNDGISKKQRSRKVSKKRRSRRGSKKVISSKKR